MALNLLITQNRALNAAATNGGTSTVGEPSVAVDGSRMFITGNWYAARSSDSGASWSWVDPTNTTPGAAGGFCCDQLALYDRQRGIWIWVLQYRRQNGTNVFRIAISRNAESPGATWRWWDIAPATLDPTWTNVWFDYPDAALGAQHLYVTFNVFLGDAWQRATVMRFPLDTLANGGSLGFDWWSTTRNGSLRLTQQATPGSNMYWGDQNSRDQVRLFSWPAGSGSVTWWDIDVRPWDGVISSTAPNGVNWLGRTDSRITGGTLGNGAITFMWTAGADANRPHPYCRVIRIDEGQKTLRDEPDIWSSSRAWAYPAACVGSGNALGFAAFYGGGDRHPGLAVGGRDDAAGAWRTSLSRVGTHSPSDGKWGDYITCGADSLAPNSWAACGFTLEGGAARTNIVPRVVRFQLQ